MSVPFKPHAFRVRSFSARENADHVIEGFSPDGSGTLVRGCAQQLSPKAAYDVFGREVTDAFLFAVDYTDANLFVAQVGSEVEWRGDLYAVEKVQANEQGLSTDHIAIYAIRMRH